MFQFKNLDTSKPITTKPICGYCGKNPGWIGLGNMLACGECVEKFEKKNNERIAKTITG